MKNEKPPIKRKKSLPVLKITEDKEIKPLRLQDYVTCPIEDEVVTFHVELEDGSALPDGLTLDEKKGLFHGSPALGTAQKEPYKLLFTAQSESTMPLTLSTDLTITKATPKKAKSKPVAEGYSIREFWKAFFAGEFLDLTDILTRKISPLDVYYLLSRFATLTVWNADDLSPANTGKLVQIPGADADFLVFDFDVALVATPKDLYDHDRTVKQSIQTARAIADECRKRGWNIEMAGFDKMVTAVWLRVQEINQEAPKNKQMKILHYEPTEVDQNILINQKRLEERLKA